MPKRPTEPIRQRYADVLPPDAPPDLVALTETLERLLASPQPSRELATRLRQLAQQLPARTPAPPQSLRREPELWRPVVLVPQSATGLGSRRQSGLSRIALTLAAVLVLASLVVIYRALVPVPESGPATMSTPTPPLVTPTPAAALTASQLRAQLRYRLFVPTALPAGLTATYQTDGDPEGLVSITFRTPRGEIAFTLAQAPADRSPLPAGGEPVTLPNGITAYRFSPGGKAELAWIQEGTQIVLVGGTISGDALVSIAASLSAEADLVLVPATRSASTPVVTPVATSSPAPMELPTHLAVVDQQKLRTGSRTFTHDGGVSQPAWSPSGRWLAYHVPGLRTIVVVRTDDPASEPLALDSLIPNGPLRAFAWSPRDDVLAVAPDNGGLYLYQPGAAATQVPESEGLVTSFAWAPDGLAIAFVRQRQPFTPEATLDLVLVSLERPATTVLSSFAASEASIRLAGWSPDGRWLLYWEFPLASASLAMDGVPLRALDVTAPGKPVTIATMLAEPSALAWGKDGQTLWLIAGSDRIHWSPERQLLRCRVGTWDCQPMDLGDASVPVALAASPDGARLALVTARSHEGAFSSDSELAEWVASRRLVLLALDTEPPVPIDVPAALRSATETGVLDVQWASGETLVVLVQSPEGGQPRIVWLDVGSGTMRELLDLTSSWPAMNQPPVDAFGQLSLSLHDFVALPGQAPTVQ